MAKPAAEKIISDVPISDILRRKAEPKPFDALPTKREGVLLRVEHGTIPVVSARALGSLAVRGRRFGNLKRRADALHERMKLPEQELKALVRTLPNVRGIISKKDGLQTTVSPSYKIAWDFAKLGEALGVARSTVIAEDVNFTISVPLGHETPQGPLTSEMARLAMRSGMVQLGFSEGEIDTLVESETVPRVDEAKLHSLIASGQVALPPDVGTAYETWSLRSEPIT